MKAPADDVIPADWHHYHWKTTEDAREMFLLGFAFDIIRKREDFLNRVMRFGSHLRSRFGEQIEHRFVNYNLHCEMIGRTNRLERKTHYYKGVFDHIRDNWYRAQLPDGDWGLFQWFPENQTMEHVDTQPEPPHFDYEPPAKVSD